MSRAGGLFWRAVLLRCPNCGSGGLFRHWFALRERCPGCGLRLERGEGFYTGAWALNLVVAELLFVVGLVVWCVATWPTPPWGTIQIAAVVGTVLAPLLFWPHSRTLWLALSLLLEPAEPQELAPQHDGRVESDRSGTGKGPWNDG